MSDTSIIISKYSKACFAIAHKLNLKDEFARDLFKFNQNISPFIKELSNPLIKKKDLEQIVKDFSKKLDINENVNNFLLILAESKKLKLIKNITEELVKLIKKDNSILSVDLITTYELDDNQVEDIKNIIKKKYNASKIEVNQKINQKIIGGIIIKIDSVEIDASIQNQLKLIHQEFKSIL